MTAVLKQVLEELAFRFTMAIDVKNDLREVFLADELGRRHKKQHDRLATVLADVTVDPCAFRTYQFGGQRRCLFNIVVALEWSPSEAFLEALKDTFHQASLLLLDVTDGYMGIGQVAVGSPATTGLYMGELRRAENTHAAAVAHILGLEG